MHVILQAVCVPEMAVLFRLYMATFHIDFTANWLVGLDAEISTSTANALMAFPQQCMGCTTLQICSKECTKNLGHKV